MEYFLSLCALLGLYMICKTIERCVELVYGPDDVYLCDECGKDLDDTDA